MAGPWEDFQTTAAPKGPWEDFQKPAAKPDEAPVTWTGLGKAAGAGALSGFAGIPEDVKNIGNLVRHGIADLTGSKYDPKDDFQLPQGYENFRTGVDKLYTPQNKAEDWAKYLGGFVPAIATGPEGLAGKGIMEGGKVLAKRAVTQAAAPAAAGELASEAAQGTAMEPYAGPLAAIGTGGVLAKGKLPEGAKSTDAAALANQSFDRFRQAPVTLKAGELSNDMRDIKNNLVARGLGDTPAAKALDQHIIPPSTTAMALRPAVPLGKLQELHSDLTQMAKRPDTENGFAAAEAKRQLKDYLDNSLDASKVAMGANALPQALADMRQGQLYTQIKHQLRQIERPELKASLSNAAAHTGDNINSLRMALKGTALNENSARAVDEVMPHIMDVIHGNPLVNALRRGLSLVNGHNNFLPTLMAGEAFGIPTGITVGAGVKGAGILLNRAVRNYEDKKVYQIKQTLAGKAPGLVRTNAKSEPLLRRVMGAARGAYASQQ